MKFTEAQLEKVFIELLQKQGFDYSPGNAFLRNPDEVLIKDDLRDYLQKRYRAENITNEEIEQIIRKLQAFPSSDLYESNRAIMKMVADGFILKREDRSKKDIYIELIDYSDLAAFKQPDKDELTTIVADSANNEYGSNTTNIYKFVNQFEITGYHKRIPDGIVYINGIPLVVFEFKTAIVENTTIHDAYIQLTTRYKRDIPELFKYNAFCVISDGVNSKAGSFFANYNFYYAWRKITGDEETNDIDGINAMHSLIKGMFDKNRLRDIIRNFIFIPDTSKKDEKIVCRYPQYYAANKLYQNIKKEQRPQGSGKGGTYFGATGCGKSYTMLFLSRLLMRSVEFSSPTIVIITDRTDLDEQLSGTFTNAKGYIGDNNIISVASRDHLRKLLQGRKSGGVFLTTIHKFTEDTHLLTERTNVICISDEAHRSQTNLDQKVSVTSKGVKKTFGFAKYLHDSLPKATYVGFTGTPVDATLDVFGKIVDSYTMTESVKDKITKKIVYEGRAARVLLNNSKLKEIEKYYEKCEEEGANEYQIDESKKAMANMNAIIGDPDRIKAVAEDFVNHYEERIQEGSTVRGKAMFVCMNRKIAYDLYKNILAHLGERSSSFVQIDSNNTNYAQHSSFGESTPNQSQPNNKSSSSFEKIESTNYAQSFTNHFGSPEEWHTTNLPHRNKSGLIQFITFRLADSLPQDVLKEVEKKIEHLSDDERDVEKRKKYQYWLDKGLGSCALANREMAQVVQEAFMHHNGKKYDLLAWSIMPNHVHVLIKTKSDLPKIIQSWKSYTGKWALANAKKHNLGLDKNADKFWMPEYWDRFIRDEDHFNNTVKYILNNPKKANLPVNHPAYLFRGSLLGSGLKQELHPTQIKMVMTRGQDDPKELYDLLGTKEHRKELDRQFKQEYSNFKIAIVVDMWLTGFDVPFLDTMYIDKPIQRHNLIQTISRVNRTFKGKEKGLVVDYIGIKKQMNLALAMYNSTDQKNFEDINQSITVVKDHLDLLDRMFHKFDSKPYFSGKPLEQLENLNKAAEFVQATQDQEKRFMNLVKRLKAAYDICSASEEITRIEKDKIHFYLAVRSIVFKLTKGEAPDTAQMNAQVSKMIQNAIESEGVEELFKMEDGDPSVDIFSDDYLAKIEKIKLPNTKIKLLQKLLAKAIEEFKKVNKAKGVDFSDQMKKLVDRYNERKENDIDVLRSEVLEDFTDEIISLYKDLLSEKESFKDLGIDFEEKSFYDILKSLTKKYDFQYPDDQLLHLAKEVKKVVDDKTKYTDWSKRDDIKAELKVDLIILLAENDYPPVDRDEVYKEIFEQAENFKKYN